MPPIEPHVTLLALTPLATLGESHCAPSFADFQREVGVWVAPNIAVPRAPAGYRFSHGEEILADPNTAIFFNVGHRFRRRRLDDRGSWTEWVEIRPDLLVTMVRHLDPEAEPDPASPFPFVHGPCPPAAFLALRALCAACRRAIAIDPLVIEERSIEIVWTLLRAAYSAHAAGRRTRPGSQSLPRHAETTREIARIMASRLRTGVSLDELADAVELSPFHMCRLFRAHTGTSVHRYFTGLRLRAGAQQLLDTRDPSSTIARAFGFCSEQHFSDAFLRAFGVRPGTFRRAPNAAHRGAFHLIKDGCPAISTRLRDIPPRTSEEST